MSEKVMVLHYSGFTLELSGYSDIFEISEVIRAFVVTVQVMVKPENGPDLPPDTGAFLSAVSCQASDFPENIKPEPVGDTKKDRAEKHPESAAACAYYLHPGLRV
jgi:hypothetical protein